MSNTSKTSKSLVLTAALLALLSSPAPGMAAGPAPVDLGSAGSFVILSKSGISTTTTAGTAIVGDIGVSPSFATAITGFGLTMDSSGQFSTSPLVVGDVYAADYTDPTPTTMTTAVSDMETAYTDAAGRTLPDATELGAGNISGMTLAPGLYKWGTGVLINTGASGDPTGVTLNGGKNDVWIFQIAQDLTVGPGAIVTLSGGAQAKNIFWQVAGGTLLDTTADFKGTILCQTLIALNTGAVLNGRALAQTAVTLDQNAITTTETKKECDGLLKAEKKVFNDDQKAAKKSFHDGQKADKQAFQLTHPTSAEKKAFDDAQKAAKQAFVDAQKADKQAFAAQQITDKAQCNTLQ
jgi:Ice-binding-like